MCQDPSACLPAEVQQNPTDPLALDTLTATLTGEAMTTGPALRQLMRSREEQFDQRFADTFGQLSQKDLPEGTLLSHAAYHQRYHSGA